MQTELQREKMNCPLNGKACVDGIRSDFELKDKKCRWWTHVAGKDPQSEKVVDFGDCAMAWAPVTMLEASQMTRQGTATMQEFRNETNEGIKNFNKAVGQAAQAFRMLAEAQDRILEAVPRAPAIEHNGANGGQ